MVSFVISTGMHREHTILPPQTMNRGFANVVLNRQQT